MKKTLFFMTILISTVFLCGCNPEPAPAALSIVSINPSADATDVEIETAISAVFSEEIDVNTVHSQSFAVTSPLVTIEGTLDVQSDTVTFTPSAPLENDTPYMVTISTHVRSLSGTTMYSPYCWSFTTFPPSPYLVWSVPAPDSTGVALDTAITASLSKEIDSSSVTPQSFSVSEGETVIAGALSVEGGEISFLPSHDLSLETLYTVRLTTAISDLSGIGMASPYEWSFMTRGKIWQTPALIETENTGDAENLTLAVCGSGAAIAVWGQRDGSDMYIWANHYDPDTGWGTAEIIQNSTTWSGAYPEVAMNDSGDAMAVWLQYDNGKGYVFANSYIAGTGWGWAQQIDTGTQSASNPAIAMDGSGNVIAAWEQWDGTYYNIHANRYDTVTGWSGAELIRSDSGNSLEPCVTTDAHGNTAVGWHGPQGSSSMVYVRQYISGSGWNTPIPLGGGDQIQVAMYGNRYIIAVWSAWDGIKHDLWSKTYAPGSGWGTSELVETCDEGDLCDPLLDSDDAGNAVVVWRQFDGLLWSTWANIFTPGLGWTADTAVESDDENETNSPHAAIGPDGSAMAVWIQKHKTRMSVWSSLYAPETGWGAAALVETDNIGTADTPRVGMSSSGDAIAVWSQDDGTVKNIMAGQYTY